MATRPFSKCVLTSAARSLLHIVNDILDFSKVEAGKLTIEEVDFHLHQTVAETVDLFAERAQQKGLGLRWQLATDTPRVVRGVSASPPTDSRQLNQQRDQVHRTRRGERRSRTSNVQRPRSRKRRADFGL